MDTLATPAKRADRIRDFRRIYEITYGSAALPLPFCGPDRANFMFIDNVAPEVSRARAAEARRIFADILGVTFGWHDERSSNGTRRLYEAELASGVVIVLTAKAEHMQDEAVPAGSGAAA